MVMRNPLVSQKRDVSFTHHHHAQIIQAMINMHSEIRLVHRILLRMQVVPDLFDAMQLSSISFSSVNSVYGLPGDARLVSPDIRSRLGLGRMFC